MPTKTGAVVLRGPRNKENPSFELDGTDIKPKKYAKYLGVWLNERLMYTEHIKQVVTRAEKTVGALLKLMPNIGGPSSGKQRILHGVLQSILTYGALIWQSVLMIKK